MDDLIEEGRRYLQTGDYQKAEKTFLEIAYYSMDFRAHNELGIALARSGDHNTAAMFFYTAWLNLGKHPLILKNLETIEFKVNTETLPLLRPDQQEENCSLWIRRGDLWKEKGRYAEADHAYKKALGYNPYIASTWCNRGYCLFKQERYQESLDALNLAVEIDPCLVPAWLNKSALLFYFKRYHEAEVALKRTLHLAPDNDIVRYGNLCIQFSLHRKKENDAKKGLPPVVDNRNAPYHSGIDIFLEGKREKASAQYDLPTDGNTENPDDLIKLGVIFSEFGLYEQALDLFSQAADRDPKKSDSWYNKGVIFEKGNQHEQALAAYDMALSIDPEEILTWIGKGIALYSLKRYEEALTAFEKAITLSPDAYDTWMKDGSILLFTDKKTGEEPEKKSDLFNRSIEQAWFFKSAVLYQLGRYREASAAFEVKKTYHSDTSSLGPGLELLFSENCGLPEFKDILDEMIQSRKTEKQSIPKTGDVLIKERKNREIFSTFGSRYRLHKNTDAKTLSQTGYGLVRDQRNEEALIAFDQAIRIDPKDGDAWFGKGYLLGNQKEWDDALSAFKNAIALHCDLVNAWYNAGYILVELERYDEAREAFSQAISVDLSDIKSWIGIGFVYSKCGKEEEAMEAFEMAHLIDPLKTHIWSLNRIALKYDSEEEEKLLEYDPFHFDDPEIGGEKKKKSLFLEERDEAALEIFLRATRRDPDDAEAWFHAGIALLRLNRTKESCAALRRATLMDPFIADELFLGIPRFNRRIHERLQSAYDQEIEFTIDIAESEKQSGMAYTGLGLYHEARECYDASLTQNPNQPSVWLKKGKLHFDLKQYEEALFSGKQVLLLEPRNLPALCLIGESCNCLERYEEALIAFNNALFIDLDCSSAWYSKGIAFEHLGRVEEAVLCFNETLRVDPHYVKALLRLAQINAARGNEEETFQYYEKFAFINLFEDLDLYKKKLERKIEKEKRSAGSSDEKQSACDPYLSYLLFQKGNVLYQEGRYEESLNLFSEILGTDPEDSESWTAKGIVLGCLGREKEALDSFEQAIRFNPDYAPAWDNKGVLLGDMGREAEALLCFEKTLLLDPQYAIGWYNKGNILGTMGRIEEAVSALQKAVSIDPNHAEAFNNLGAYLFTLGKPDEALIALKKSIGIQPRSDRTLLNLAKVFSSLSRYDEALLICDQSLVLNPAYAEAWYQKGEIYRRMNQISDAIFAYDQALEIDPDYSQALDRKEVIMSRLYEKRDGQ